MRILFNMQQVVTKAAVAFVRQLIFIHMHVCVRLRKLQCTDLHFALLPGGKQAINQLEKMQYDAVGQKIAQAHRPLHAPSARRCMSLGQPPI